MEIKIQPKSCKMNNGVPQGSVLGPGLINVCYHLVMSSAGMASISVDTPMTHSFTSYITCIPTLNDTVLNVDIQSRMAENVLKFSQDKTEALVFGTEAQRTTVNVKLRTGIKPILTVTFYTNIYTLNQLN